MRHHSWLWLATLFAGLLALLRPAEAREYNLAIRISDQQDLYDLQRQDLLTEEEFIILQDLLLNPLDLNTATREELTDLPHITSGRAEAILEARNQAAFNSIGDLVGIDHLTDELVADMAAFAYAVPSEDFAEGDEKEIPFRFDPRGMVRYSILDRLNDDQVPSMALELTSDWSRYGVTAAVTALERTTFSGQRYLGNDRGNIMVADGDKPTLSVPKFYVSMKQERFSFVLGTYQIAFGQGLTYSTRTGNRRGFKGDSSFARSSDVEVPSSLGSNPDFHTAGSSLFRPQQQERGAAGQFRLLDGAQGTLDVTAFFSHQDVDVFTNNVSQLLQERDVDSECNIRNITIERPDRATIPTCVRPDDDSETFHKTSFKTLEDVYTEIRGGANLNYAYSDRTHAGLTFYRASFDYNINAPEIYAKPLPRDRKGYGAVGFNGAFGWNILDVWADVAMMQSSGREEPAVLVRTILDFGKMGFGLNIDLSLRSYPETYDNRFNRAISDADQFDGLRGRDERGARLTAKLTAIPGLTIVGQFDQWEHPSTGVWDREQFLRLSYRLHGIGQATTEVLWHDEDIGVGGRDLGFRDECSYTLINGQKPIDAVADGELIIADSEDAAEAAGARGRGSSIRWTGSISSDSNRQFRGAAGFSHKWYDQCASSTYPEFLDEFAQDVSFWMEFGMKRWKGVQPRVRFKYVDEFTTIGERGDRYYEGYVVWDHQLPWNLRYQLRYALRVWDSSILPVKRDREPSFERYPMYIWAVVDWKWR